MYTRNLNFRFYTSSTAGEVPTLLQNYFGRVWLNTADGILYSTKYVNNVLTLVSTIIGKNVKRYSCFIAQDGAGAPVPTVLEDNLGGPVWSRVGVGSYLLTKVDAFTAGKTKPLKAVAINIDGHKMTAEWVDKDKISFKTYDAVDITTLADDVFALDEINIEVYD